MRKFVTIFLPILLILVSIISSFISFHYNNQLEDGYIYLNNQEKAPVYTAEYNMIVGNIEDSAYYLSVSVETNGVSIRLYDIDKSLLKEYLLVVSDTASFDPQIIEDILTSEFTALEELDETILSLNLISGVSYSMTLTEVTNNTTTDEIDIVFYYLPYDIYNKKRLFENVAFTTMIFTFITVVTVIGARITKQD